MDTGNIRLRNLFLAASLQASACTSPSEPPRSPYYAEEELHGLCPIFVTKVNGALGEREGVDWSKASDIRHIIEGSDHFVSTMYRGNRAAATASLAAARSRAVSAARHLEASQYGFGFFTMLILVGGLIEAISAWRKKDYLAQILPLDLSSSTSEAPQRPEKPGIKKSDGDASDPQEARLHQLLKLEWLESERWDPITLRAMQVIGIGVVGMTIALGVSLFYHQNLPPLPPSLCQSTGLNI